jgi:hypothetical protein
VPRVILRRVAMVVAAMAFAPIAGAQPASDFLIEGGHVRTPGS